MINTENAPDKNEMTAKIKLSYSEIHRIIEALAYTIQMRDESDGPAMKGLKSLKILEILWITCIRIRY